MCEAGTKVGKKKVLSEDVVTGLHSWKRGVDICHVGGSTMVRSDPGV